MLTQREIETHALSILQRANALSPPINLEKIAIYLDANIHEQIFEDQVSGALVIKDGGKHILVNSSHHRNRQRFTIAHEIGHLSLHTSDVDLLVDQLFVDTQMRVYQRVGGSDSAAYQGESSTTTPEQEREANQFAAALLMPEQLLRERVDQNMLADEHDVSILAKEFGVSEQAMYIRLQKLELVEGYYL